MTWKKRKRIHKGKNDSYSVVRKLRNENKSDDTFEVKVNNLSLEELIALKLELSSNDVGGTLFGLPLWTSMPDIVRDGLLRYALSATRTKGEAMRLLGLTSKDYKKLVDKFKPEIEEDVYKKHFGDS